MEKNTLLMSIGIWEFWTVRMALGNPKLRAESCKGEEIGGVLKALVSRNN